MFRNTRIFLFGLLSAVVLLGACSNDLDLNSEYKEVPIVYAIISTDQAVNYLRIEKAYLGGNRNALDVATEADSIYYGDSLQVKVIGVNTGTTFELERVSGDSLNLPKDDGIFASSPNILYRMNGLINPDEPYRLEVFNPETGLFAHSNINVVKEFNIFRPKSNDTKIALSDDDLQVRFRSAENARVYDIYIRFHYKEWHFSDPTNKTDKHIDWLAANNIIGNNTDGDETLLGEYSGKAFFNYLRDQLEANPDLVRQFDETKKLEYYFIAGGTEFYDYVRIQRAQSGITSNQALPTYTNVENAIGVFSSRYTQIVPQVDMLPRSIDSLSCGSITDDLNFLDSSGDPSCQ